MFNASGAPIRDKESKPALQSRQGLLSQHILKGAQRSLFSPFHSQALAPDAHTQNASLSVSKNSLRRAKWLRAAVGARQFQSHHVNLKMPNDDDWNQQETSQWKEHSVLSGEREETGIDFTSEKPEEVKDRALRPLAPSHARSCLSGADVARRTRLFLWEMSWPRCCLPGILAGHDLTGKQTVLALSESPAESPLWNGAKFTRYYLLLFVIPWVRCVWLASSQLIVIEREREREREKRR